MSNNLRGAQIIVTRPLRQADNLCKLIQQNGGNAIQFPLLDISAKTPEPLAIQTAIAADWLIFTSVNAVDFAITALSGTISRQNAPKIAAIGSATANRLRQAGWQISSVPTQDFSSEGLLALPEFKQISQKRIVIVRGAGGREKLADELRQRGAEISYLEVYQRLKPVHNSGSLAIIRNQKPTALTITSGEALENLPAMLDHELLSTLQTLPIVVVSTRIGQIAGQLGFKRIITSRQATDAAILETLTTLFNGDNSG